MLTQRDRAIYVYSTDNNGWKTATTALQPF